MDVSIASSPKDGLPGTVWPKAILIHSIIFHLALLAFAVTDLLTGWLMGSDYDPYRSQHVLAFGEIQIPNLWFLEVVWLIWCGIGLSSAVRHWQTQELGFYDKVPLYCVGGMLLVITITGLLALGGV